MRIAIIGAGMAGLTLARRLGKAATVNVLEKSRGLGGRMATRQAAPFAFDHGAQYFSGRDRAFRSFLDPYQTAGIVRPWEGRFVTIGKASGSREERMELGFVAAPRMTSLAKAMAESVEVRLETEITGIEYNESGWWLPAKSRAQGPFDWVVSTAPAPQTRKLLPGTFSGAAAIRDVKMTGCFALMLGFDVPLSLPFDAASVTDSLIGWIAVNSSKPGRDAGFSLIAQSTNAWAEAHLEDDQANIRNQMIDELASLTGQEVRRHKFAALHRWRYADSPAPLGRPFLFDPALGLGACGDWCLSGRVESAFLSANALADELLAMLGRKA